MVQMLLIGTAGEPLGALRAGADEIIIEAEQYARNNTMSKRRCFPLILRQHVEAAGCTVTDGDLDDAVGKLEGVRGGVRPAAIQLRVKPDEAGGAGNTQGQKMSAKLTPLSRFFEAERVYPNPDAREWYDRLVGIDDHKKRLLLELELLLYPDRLADWSRKHHGKEIRACKIMASRVLLVLLEGDVGCGKTVLAETIGDPLTDLAGGKVHLLKINTQVRGTGMVGEMTDLIVQAFAQAEQRADALKGARPAAAARRGRRTGREARGPAHAPRRQGRAEHPIAADRRPPAGRPTHRGDLHHEPARRARPGDQASIGAPADVSAARRRAAGRPVSPVDL